MKQSKIAGLIKLSGDPVAVLRAAGMPENCLHFDEDAKWGCVMPFLAAAAKGKTAAFSMQTTPCLGGKAGLGFCPLPEGLDFFLSTGGKGEGRMAEGEFYKRTPELARAYRLSMPSVVPSEVLVFKPLGEVAEGETPGSVIFLVNADQLSALSGLAFYDNADPDAVRVLFGAGCAQSVLFALKEQESGGRSCFIGITDLSARKFIDKDLLSFSMPYGRFLEMESAAEESFLTKETWQGVAKRIQTQ
ncbi:MAG: DUF169 domain-containing protein [Mailhella sp.]|nr:DUF169 domain-containing protein [Mailhella sp.]